MCNRKTHLKSINVGDDCVPLISNSPTSFGMPVRITLWLEIPPGNTTLTGILSKTIPDVSNNCVRTIRNITSKADRRYRKFKPKISYNVRHIQIYGQWIAYFQNHFTNFFGYPQIFCKLIDKLSSLPLRLQCID